MSHYVYIILSKKNSKIKTYVGYTNNLKKRLLKHNSGTGAKATKGRKWKFIYKEKFDTKNKALSREYFIKKNSKLRKKIVNSFIGF